MSLADLHALLAELSRGVVRVKGVLNLAKKPLHRCLLQVPGGQATVTVGRPWRDETPATRLVFIGLPDGIEASRTERLRTGEASRRRSAMQGIVAAASEKAMLRNLITASGFRLLWLRRCLGLRVLGMRMVCERAPIPARTP